MKTTTQGVDTVFPEGKIETHTQIPNTRNLFREQSAPKCWGFLASVCLFV